MANFALIYQILSLLDEWLDDPSPDYSELSAERFKASEKRFVSIMVMLYDAGYIDGIRVIELGGDRFDIKLIRPAITLKGLEYLENNDTMHKAYRFLKGFKEILPGA